MYVCLVVDKSASMWCCQVITSKMWTCVPSFAKCNMYTNLCALIKNETLTFIYCSQR